MKTGIIFTAIVLSATAAFGQDTVCLDCHSASAHKAHPTAQTVDPAAVKASVHSTLGCTDCHTVDPGTNHRGNRVVFCARCHQKEAEGFNRSPHVKGRAVGIDKLPTCVTCHGGHAILAVTDPKAATNHTNSVKICTACHEDANVTGQMEALDRKSVV